MEFYTEDELDELLELVKNKDLEISEIIKFVKDTELKDKIVICNYEVTDETREKIGMNIVQHIPDAKITDFFKNINLNFIEFYYNKYALLKNFEVFEIVLNRIATEQKEDDGLLEYILNKTDTRNCSRKNYRIRRIHNRKTS